MRSSLRVFSDGEENQPAVTQVTMTVGEFCRILKHACDSDRTWLQDFEHDEIRLPADLYDVMQAYWSFRPAA